VADKGRVKRSIKELQRVKTWQLVVLLILAGFLAATFLRLNSIGMIERRDAVLSADEAGNDEVTVQRLYDLQRYVSAHMNTTLGQGVYLEASFNRDLQAWQAEEYGDRNPNGNIYKKAQEVCAPKFSGYSAAYLRCTTDELAKYPSAEDLGANTSKPRQEAYIKNFVSPTWSPDFAGWALVICAVLVLLIIIRLVSLGVLRLMLSRHYRNA
jgi:hypothetical protein